MSTVTLQIGGKSYAVACADGEESHIAKLGSMIDAKFAQMGDNLAPQEVQNFLFASLILADELHEAKQASAAPASTPSPSADDADDKPKGKKSELRAEIDQLKLVQASLESERDSLAEKLKAAEEVAHAATENADQHDMFGQDVLAARLESLAAQAEACAEALESDAPTS